MKSTKNLKTTKFVLGDKVVTTKGSRMSSKKARGTIVGFGTWKEYPAAKVKKTTGTIRLFLIKNLNKV